MENTLIFSSEEEVRFGKLLLKIYHPDLPDLSVQHSLYHH